ncbi:hypothetical protein D3C80_881000 [compost metagenome]
MLAGPVRNPQRLARQAHLPVADIPGVDDGDQLVALIDHGDRQRQKQDEDGHRRHGDGQYQGRSARRIERRGGLDRRHRQGGHGDMVHPDHGQSQNQRRRQPPQGRPILLDGEQGGDRGEQGDGRRQDDQSGRIGQGRRRPQRRHADIVHGANADPHDQARQNHAAAVLSTRGDQEGEAGPDDGQQEGQDRQRQVVANRRLGMEAQHGDEMHRPYAAAHGRRRRGQPGQTPAALMGPHLLEQVQRRPGREDRDQKGQAVEDGNDV